MGARRDDLVEVVLDDARGPDAPDPGAGDGSHQASRWSRRSRRPWSPRRRRAVTAAGLALAVGALAVRWDAATLWALPVEGVPGLTVSLAAPLHVVWQADGRILAPLPDESAVLVWSPDAVESRDAASGAVLWRFPEAVAWCDLASSDQAGSQPEPIDGADAPRASRQIALCTLADGATVEALDAATGDVLVELDQQMSMWSPSVVDGDLVVAGVDTSGHPMVARWSSATGELLWTTVGPAVDTVNQGVLTRVDGSVVTVDWAGGSMDVDVTTGAQLPVTDAPPADGPVVVSRVGLADGSVVTQEWRVGSAGIEDAQVRVVRPDGSPLLTAPGYLLQASVDDGSAPGIVLVLDDGSALTRAYDLAAGAEAWEGDLLTYGVLGGRLVGWGVTDELTAISPGTGDVVWKRQAPRANNTSGMVSDGRRLLSLEGRGMRLVARSLATGREVWSVDQPWISAASADAYGALMSVLPSGRVALSSGDTTVVLGP